MLAEFIQKIIDISKPATIVSPDGLTYVSGDYNPMLALEPRLILTSTLSSIIEIAPTLKIDDLMIHIGSNRVDLIGPLLEVMNQRFTYASAIHSPLQHRFGQFLSLEDFIIYIQSSFIHDDETARMMKIVGNLTDEAIKNNKDDGVTQQVTMRTSVARVENVDVKNPFVLRPFRTFHEIEQPKSQFVLRMRQSQAAIFIADYNNWQIEAIQSIKEWFEPRTTMTLIG